MRTALRLAEQLSAAVPQPPIVAPVADRMWSDPVDQQPLLTASPERHGSLSFNPKRLDSSFDVKGVQPLQTEAELRHKILETASKWVRAGIFCVGHSTC
jgi:hypothetical protein